jgi:hypothetical protein
VRKGGGIGRRVGQGVVGMHPASTRQQEQEGEMSRVRWRAGVRLRGRRACRGLRALESAESSESRAKIDCRSECAGNFRTLRADRAGRALISVFAVGSLGPPRPLEPCESHAKESSG